MKKGLLSFVLLLAMVVSLLVSMGVTASATDSAESDKTVLSSTKIGSTMATLFANTTTYNKDFDATNVQSIGFIRSETVPDGYTVVTGAEGTDYAGVAFQFQEGDTTPIYLAYKANGSMYDVVFYSAGTIYSPATFIDMGTLAGLTTVTFENFNTSDVTNLASAFKGCQALASVDLSGWDTSKVTTFIGMFHNCKALTELDLSSFTTTSATAAGLQQLLKGCTGLKMVNLSNFNLAGKTNFADMIDDCTNLLALVTPAAMPTGTSSVTLPNTFYYDNGAKSINKLDKNAPTSTLLSRRFQIVFTPGNDATMPQGTYYYYGGRGLDLASFVPEPNEGFKGWLLNGEPITSISATQSGDLYLHGDWEVGEAHEHEYEYTSNGNGTHNGACDCGEDAITNEACAYGDDEVCDKCAYDSHKHDYEYTSNGNGTHNGACDCGEDAITNENCEFVEGVCSKCGYVKTYVITLNESGLNNGYAEVRLYDNGDEVYGMLSKEEGYTMALPSHGSYALVLVYPNDTSVPFVTDPVVTANGVAAEYIGNEDGNFWYYAIEEFTEDTVIVVSYDEPTTWNLSDILEENSEAFATAVKPGDIIVNDLSKATWFHVADRYYCDEVELNPGEYWTVPTEFAVNGWYDNGQPIVYSIVSDSYTWMIDGENDLWLVKTADAKPIELINVETAQNENGKFTATFTQEAGFVYVYMPMEDFYEEGINADEFISTELPLINASTATSRQTASSLSIDELPPHVIIVTNGSFEVDSSVLGTLYKFQKVDDVFGKTDAYLMVGGAMVAGGRIARDITVAATENGTVTASVSTAKELDEVTLTVTPAEGYALESLTVKDAQGNSVAVEDNAFIMPKSAVTVEATFVAESSNTEAIPVDETIGLYEYPQDRYYVEINDDDFREESDYHWRYVYMTAAEGDAYLATLENATLGAAVAPSNSVEITSEYIPYECYSGNYDRLVIFKVLDAYDASNPTYVIQNYAYFKLGDVVDSIKVAVNAEAIPEMVPGQALVQGDDYSAFGAFMGSVISFVDGEMLDQMRSGVMDLVAKAPGSSEWMPVNPKDPIQAGYTYGVLVYTSACAAPVNDIGSAYYRAYFADRGAGVTVTCTNGNYNIVADDANLGDVTDTAANFAFIVELLTTPGQPVGEPEEEETYTTIQNIGGEDGWVKREGNTVTITPPSGVSYFVEVIYKNDHGDMEGYGNSNFGKYYIIDPMMQMVGNLIVTNASDLNANQGAGCNALIFKGAPKTGSTTITLEESLILVVVQVDPTVKIDDYYGGGSGSVCYAVKGVYAEEVIVRNQVTDINVSMDEDALPQYTVGGTMTGEAIELVVSTTPGTSSAFRAVGVPGVMLSANNYMQALAPEFLSMVADEIGHTPNYNEILAFISQIAESEELEGIDPRFVAIIFEVLNPDYELEADDQIGMIFLVNVPIECELAQNGTISLNGNAVEELTLSPSGDVFLFGHVLGNPQPGEPEEDPYKISLDIDELINAEAGVVFFPEGIFAGQPKGELWDPSESVALDDNTDSAVVIVYAKSGYVFEQPPVVTVNGTPIAGSFEDGAYFFDISGFSGDSIIKVIGEAVKPTLEAIDITLVQEPTFDAIVDGEVLPDLDQLIDMGVLSAEFIVGGNSSYANYIRAQWMYAPIGSDSLQEADYNHVANTAENVYYIEITVANFSSTFLVGEGLAPGSGINITNEDNAFYDVHSFNFLSFEAAESANAFVAVIKPASDEPEHEHSYTYTANGNGTHNGACDCGEDAITNAACTYGDNEVCDLCGYDSHEHSYTYTANGNGTHNGACTCGEDAITNAACTYGDDEVCDLCGYDSHEHSYTYTTNGNGTHNGACACGEDAITNETCTYVGGQCTKCGYAEPVTPPAPPTVNVPVSNNDNKVDVEAEISGNDATIKPLDQSQIDQLVGSGNASGDVVIDLSTLGEKIDTAGIPKSTLEAIVNAAEDAGNDTEQLVIKLSTGVLTLDDTAMRAIVDQAAGDVIKFNFDDVGLDRLNATQKDAVQDMDIRKGYEAYITVNDQRIGDFRGGEVEIVVPYVVPEGEELRFFSVWYIADDGSLEKQESTYDGKEKCFIVNHFSDYVIVYEPESSNHGWVLLLCLGIAILLIGGALVVYFTVRPKVFLDLNGVTPDTEIAAGIKVCVGAKIKLPVPSAAGRRFVGWCYDKNGEYQIKGERMGFKSFILYAKWEEQ